MRGLGFSCSRTGTFKRRRGELDESGDWKRDWRTRCDAKLGLDLASELVLAEAKLD